MIRGVMLATCAAAMHARVVRPVGVRGLCAPTIALDLVPSWNLLNPSPLTLALQPA
jgi:hypothetical protein